MSFNGTEGAPISLEEGAKLTSAYRKANPNTTLGVFIGREHIQSLLDPSSAMGIRVYFGKDGFGTNTIVVVAADANEDDMLDLIIDNGPKSPPCSGVANDLNS